MPDEKSLDDILTGQQDEAPPIQSPEAEAQSEPGKDAEAPEPKQEDAEPEKPAEPKATEDEPDPKAWQYAAYKDERTKRQEWETKARESEGRLQTLERELRELKKPKPVDPYEDPEGYAKQQQQTWEEREADLRKEILNERYNFSQMTAEQSYGKEKVDEALEWAKSLPQAERVAITQTPHPYAEVVERKKRHDALKEVGDDPEAWRTAERERIKAEVLEELKATPQTPATPMPTNLAGARNAGSRTGPAWAGPPSIDDIFEQRK